MLGAGARKVRTGHRAPVMNIQVSLSRLMRAVTLV